MTLYPVIVTAVAVGLAVPLGLWLAAVFDGRHPAVLKRLDRPFDTGPADWKGYSFALLAFNALTFVVAFAVLASQSALPLNPDGKEPLAASTVLHTTVSFVANNSLQHYSGEAQLSYASQLFAIVWTMFTGGGTGLAAFAAVTRGVRGDESLGSFTLDLWRGVMYALLPVSLVFGLLFLAAGVPMTFDGAAGTIARGPVAALVPAKLLASVGGGFFAANSAHPFENPAAWTNAAQTVAILLFPMAVVVAYGRMLGRPRHAAVLFVAMLALFAAMTAWAVHAEAAPNPALHGLPVVPGPNLEGKELRFPPATAATFVSATTAVSCGATDCAHDSLNPLTQLTPLAGMWLACVFGGKGAGFLQLLLYVILTVFFAGLMVGRTPEYLGRKVEAREMKLAMLALLAHPLLILAPAGLCAATSWGAETVGNPGSHGLTEIVYEFSSSAAGNGSGMEGLADSAPLPWATAWDVATALVILFGRYVPLVAPLALAGCLSRKPAAPQTVGTLRTDTATFGIVLLAVVVVVGALLFLPVAVLGPVAEQLAVAR